LSFENLVTGVEERAREKCCKDGTGETVAKEPAPSKKITGWARRRLARGMCPETVEARGKVRVGRSRGNPPQEVVPGR